MNKTYIAPSIELEDMGLQSMLSVSYQVDPTKTVGGTGDQSGGVGQLSNRLLWGDDEEGF